jgi:phage host-nuclease inhibitor protein Gam
MIAPNEQMGGNSALNEMEKTIKSYAELRRTLALVVQELNDKLEKLKRERLPVIKRLVERAAEKHAELETMIAANREMFAKPRTITLYGIKCGFRKNEGSIEYDDAEAVVAKIRQHLANPTGFLHVTEKPNKEALAGLPAGELKKLGCRICDTGDVIVIKPVDGDVERVVGALFKAEVKNEAAN